VALTTSNRVLTNTTALAVKIARSTGGGPSPRLDGLEDVRETSRANNNILVYNADRDLFLLESPKADGGTF
jgi:hypothetical protein|tara:strand:- start:528 stop:740 length:213 start_codon:yes stop_codon:yes gene_type:complete